MGSGKTFVGKALSEKMHWDFIDTDEAIEEKTHLSIKKIFSIYGENTFRNYELGILQKITKKKKIIIATGGGLPIYNNNMYTMNKTGTTIYLKCSLNKLFTRLKKEKATRPLINNFSNNELKEFIQTELQNREKYYMKANHIIKIKNLNTEDILSKINTYIL